MIVQLLQQNERLIEQPVTQSRIDLGVKHAAIDFGPPAATLTSEGQVTLADLSTFVRKAAYVKWGTGVHRSNFFRWCVTRRSALLFCRQTSIWRFGRTLGTLVTKLPYHVRRRHTLEWMQCICIMHPKVRRNNDPTNAGEMRRKHCA